MRKEKNAAQLGGGEWGKRGKVPTKVVPLKRMNAKWGIQGKKKSMGGKVKDGGVRVKTKKPD